MSNPGEPFEESPRIIVDEDWKAQVQREKEAQAGVADETQSAGAAEDFPLPPPSLSGMISMFASQAMAALGYLPDPLTGEAEVNRPMAKFLIDTLGVLEQKTEGNRAEAESNELRDALHHLRMLYVATPSPSPVPPNEQPTRPSQIELP